MEACARAGAVAGCGVAWSTVGVRAAVSSWGRWAEPGGVTLGRLPMGCCGVPCEAAAGAGCPCWGSSPSGVGEGSILLSSFS